MVEPSQQPNASEKSAGFRNRRSFVDVLLWLVIVASVIFLGWPWIDRGRTFFAAYMGQKKLRAEYQAAVGSPTHDGYETVRAGRWPYTRIVIPKINLDAIVIQGVDDRSLMYGPGHDPLTSIPGRGNCVIAGHRNTAGWWFNHLDTLKPDDTISLVTMGKTYQYQVKKVRTVSTTDTHLLKPTKNAQLTLYTCTVPKTPRRIVVTAALEEPRKVQRRH